MGLNSFGLKLILIVSLAATAALVGSCSRQDQYIELRAEIALPQSNITIREGESVLFRAAASGGAPPYRHIWNFGLMAPDFSGQHTPEIIFKYEGAYTVVLTVIDSLHKQASDEAKVLVTRREMLY